MARVFGVVSTVDGVTASLLQSIQSGSQATLAEARAADGKVTDMIAYSVTQTANCEIVVDDSDTEFPAAGTSITVGSVTGLVDNVQYSETNTGYKSATVSITTADAALLEEYDGTLS
jgi:hypothetical protein